MEPHGYVLGCELGHTVVTMARKRPDIRVFGIQTAILSDGRDVVQQEKH